MVRRSEAGLGAEFESELDHAIQRIRKLPGAYPEVKRGARRHLIRRSPYAVYYRLRDDEIRVFAVIHTARAPGVWQKRAAE